MAANVEMQGIEFQIINDSEDASKGIEKLSSALENLKSSIGNSGTQLSKAADGIRQLKNALNDVKLSSFTKSIKSVADSLKPMSEMKFNGITKFIGEINKLNGSKLLLISQIDFSNLKEAADNAKAISGVSRVSNAAKSVKSELPPVTDMRTVEVPVQTATMSEEFEETRRKAEELKDTIGNTNSVDAFIKSKSAVDILSMKLDEIKGKIADLRKEGGDNAPGLASLVERAQKLQEQIDNAGKSTEKTNSRVKDFIKSLKRIAMYRAVRSVISGITSSVKEGIQNLAQYSSALNGTDSSGLNNTLSQYAAKLLQLKNAIGAAIAPMLQALLPAFNTIAELAVKAANAINQFFSAMNGQTTYTKAIYNAVDYADSLNGATDAANKLKKSVMGFDELNILPDNSTIGTGDYGVVYEDMFKEEEIGSGMQEFGKWAKDNLQEIITMIGSVWLAIKAVEVVSWATNVTKKLKALKIIDKLKNVKTNFTGIQKGAIVAVAAVAEFATIKSVVKDLASGSEDVGTKIAEIGVAATAAGAVMYAVMGPAGIAMAAVTGLTAVLVGAKEAYVEFYYEVGKTEYYNKAGVAISEVQTALTNYFNALDFDKQSEWIEKIEASQKTYDDAALSYDELWKSLSQKTEFSTVDIEDLTEAITNLADAAKELNSVKFASLMSSIKTSIELNITGELSDRLGGLVDKLEQAQALIDTKITGLASEYQQILSDISSNGGVATSEQKEKMSQLRSDITKFTLSDDASSARWSIEIEDALKGAINAGTDKDSVIANIEDLMSDRDTYLDSLKDKYASDMNTLEQLINLDKTEYGGALGFSASDLETLKASYEAQISEVYSKYNAVLDQIIATYEKGMVNWTDDGIFGFDDLANWVMGLFGDDYSQQMDAQKQLDKEQKELLEKLKKYRIGGYATGGFPTTGELFIANEAGPELVGTIGGHTAVGNTDQIETAMENAAYRGVRAAMSEGGSSSGGQTRVIVATVDGRVLFETLVDEARNDTVRTGHNRLVEV